MLSCTLEEKEEDEEEEEVVVFCVADTIGLSGRSVLLRDGIETDGSKDEHSS